MEESCSIRGIDIRTAERAACGTLMIKIKLEMPDLDKPSNLQAYVLHCLGEGLILFIT